MELRAPRMKPKRRKPRQIEHAIQCSVIADCRLLQWKYPELRYLHSSQSGARLSPGAAAKQKAAGMVAGVPDLFLPLPIPRGSCGLYLEMKAPDGVVSSNQKDFMEYLQWAGFKAVVCYSAPDAMAMIIAYCEQARLARACYPKQCT